MSHVSDNVEHQLFDGCVTQVLGRLVVVLGFQNVLHDEDDVLNELSVGLVHNYLFEERKTNVMRLNL